jgi:hypothetical protein
MVVPPVPRQQRVFSLLLSTCNKKRSLPRQQTVIYNSKRSQLLPGSLTGQMLRCQCHVSKQLYITQKEIWHQQNSDKVAPTTKGSGPTAAVCNEVQNTKKVLSGSAIGLSSTATSAKRLATSAKWAYYSGEICHNTKIQISYGFICKGFNVPSRIQMLLSDS